MKILSGQELADYIKERQRTDVRRLAAQKIQPKLVIFYDNDSPVIAKYMQLKHQYGADIGIITEIIKITPENAIEKLTQATQDPATHGIIIQLPLKSVPENILTHIPPEKDVDGLNNSLDKTDLNNTKSPKSSQKTPTPNPNPTYQNNGFDSATATAINWLLTAYNIDLKGKNIAIVGRGKLIGAPLSRMWQNSGLSVTTFKKGDDLTNLINFDIIVSATGVAGLITPAMLRIGATVIDAGTASENGVLKGDLSPAARTRPDLTLTPKTGGVGPLTVTALFDHTIQAANNHQQP